MSEMGRHSRLTGGQRTLAASIAILAVALTPVFFTVMFLAVTHLLAASFGDWSWTVPVATEISFTLLFLLWVLLEWRDRAPGWLRFAPYPFAAASLWLNVYGSRGDVPGMVGHGVVTIAFFVPLLALKAAVSRLTVSDEERKRSVAVNDAIDHAKDILRAADPWWRFRAPVLLRRQLRSRRLPAPVLKAVADGAVFGGSSKWEPAVEEWITRSLTLPEGVAVQLAAARAAASQSAVQSEPVVTPAPPTVVTPAMPAPPPRSDSAGASRSDSARRRVVPSKASDDELAELVLPLFADGSEVTKYRVIKAVREASGGKAGIGDKRAGVILELAQRKHRAQRVVPIGDRKQA